jgi:PAS domain S-box-containing protein
MQETAGQSDRPMGDSEDLKVSVLLVDDDAANLLALRALLQDLGHELVQADSGEAALWLLKTRDFALVLLDVRMPGIDGFETARRIRNHPRSQHTPIIFVTANDVERDQLEAGYELGAVDFLSKPLLPIAVKAKVRGFIELYQDKQRARREAEQLRLLVQGTTDYAIFLLDEAGRVVTWNPGAERLKGYTATEIIGQHFSRFYPQDAIDRRWPEYELQVAREAGRLEDEGWRLRKDGSKFWANVVITALRDEAGSLQGFSKITRDLTERKKAEDDARLIAEEATARRVAEEQSERLRVTLASIGDGVITTDAEGRVEFLNPVAELLVGWTTDDARGRDLTQVFDIVNEYTRDAVSNPALRALVEGIIVGLANHTVLISKDGTERPIDDAAAPIKDATGKVLGSVLVFRDVSEHKWREKLRNARLSVTTVLNQAASIDDGATGVLRAVAQSLGWDVGIIWTVSEDGESLICSHSWGRSDSGAELFTKSSCDHAIAPGEGLPGRVWQSGESTWIVDIESDSNMTRRTAARECGLRSAFACPIVVDDLAIGVMEYFAATSREVDEDLLEMMGTVATGFGQFVKRQLGLDELATSQRRLGSELEAMTRLHALSTRLLRSTDLDGALADVLAETIRTSESDLGVIQLYNERRACLEIAAHQGVPQEFLEHFREVRLDETSACARAMSSGDRVVIEDVELDSSYEPHRHIASLAGYRAVQSTALKNRSGRVIGILSTHFRAPRRLSDRDLRLIDLYARHAADVIERTRTEDTLRRSEAQFRQLADAMPQIVWSAAPTGQITYLNQRWTEFTGRPADRGNEAWSGVLHPEDAPAARERWQRSLERSERFESELRLLNKDGHYCWHLMRTVPVHDPDGNIIQWYGTATAIDHQKRVEETSRYLAEASAELAGVVDYESTLQRVANLAVPYFADWSAADVAEEKSLRRLAVAHAEPAKLDLVRQIEKEYPTDLSADTGVGQVLKTGESILISDITDEMLSQGTRDARHLELIRQLGLRSYICVPLIIAGRVYGVLTFATAESGRRFTEADLRLAKDLAYRASIAIQNTQLFDALKLSDRRKDEFLATLAHELRNPLAPIRNGLQILDLIGSKDAESVETRAMMDRQLTQMVRLVDDLLDISRISRNRLELRKARIDLAEVIAHAVEASRASIEQAGHLLLQRLPKEPIQLIADSARLSQILSNLLNNSIKYTKPGGRIELSADVDDREVVVKVIDNGVGIPAASLPHIFEMFAQVNSDVGQGGLGIGLTLVRRLVELHGGTITASSSGTGAGSTFEVRLPVDPDSLPTTQAAGGDVTTFPSPRKVLVVDDNQDAAKSLGRMLVLAGQDVRLAHDGQAAIDVAETFRPDVILLDIGLPALNGYEVCRHLRERLWTRTVPIIALTGWGQEEDRRRSADAGFDLHLVKPIDGAQLRQAMNTTRGRKTSE